MNRALGSLGLACKAGRVQSGQAICDKLIKAGSAHLILIDAGASANTRKAVTDACAYYEVPLIYAPEHELGDAIGKPGRMVAAITDPSMADRILELANAER